MVRVRVRCIVEFLSPKCRAPLPTSRVALVCGWVALPHSWAALAKCWVPLWNGRRPLFLVESLSWGIPLSMFLCRSSVRSYSFRGNPVIFYPGTLLVPFFMVLKFGRIWNNYEVSALYFVHFSSLFFIENSPLSLETVVYKRCKRCLFSKSVRSKLWKCLKDFFFLVHS